MYDSLFTQRIGKKIEAGSSPVSSGKPYAPPVSGTDPRSARVGTMRGRPVNAAAAGFFSFSCGFFLLFFRFSIFFWFFVSFSFFRFFFLKNSEHF
jgi:hypothetical protein